MEIEIKFKQNLLRVVSLKDGSIGKYKTPIFPQPHQNYN